MELRLLKCKAVLQYAGMIDTPIQSRRDALKKCFRDHLVWQVREKNKTLPSRVCTALRTSEAHMVEPVEF